MIETAIDTLLQRLRRRGLLTRTVKLYADCIKAKFYQARWSLDVLREIEHIPNIKESTSSQEAWYRITIDYKLQFFCECFWDFLRSSVDITAQLINELKVLRIPETEVTFYKVLENMSSPPSTALLFKAIKSCKSSWAFKELNSYRHCSTHRRQVCIFESPTSPSIVTKSYEYVSESATKKVNRYLCSNPWSLNPRSSLKRPLVNYNERILETIEKRLSIIVGRLP